MAWEKIVDKKMNQDYVGHAEKATYTFSLGPEQLPGTGWSRDQIINSHVQKLQEQGSKLLELRVWEDTDPTWQTHYYVEVVATASPLWWNIIIGGVLLLLIGIAIYFSINKVESIAEYVGEEAGGVGISLMMIAGIGVIALVGIALLKRKSSNPRKIGKRG